jgi:hypothetical protein
MLENTIDAALEDIEDSSGEDIPTVPDDVANVTIANVAGLVIDTRDLTPRQQELLNELAQDYNDAVAEDPDEFQTREDIEAGIERRRLGRQLTIERINDHRFEKQENCFNIAESWSKKPDLSPAERCHGVAWEIQKNYGDTFGVDDHGNVFTANVGQEYAELYDIEKAPDIRDGLVRSASDLFS